jgi:hypothetical protein
LLNKQADKPEVPLTNPPVAERIQMKKSKFDSLLSQFDGLSEVLKCISVTTHTDVNDIRLARMDADLLARIPSGTETSSDGGYVNPGYYGSVAFVVADGSCYLVKASTDHRGRNNYETVGERVLDRIVAISGYAQTEFVVWVDDCGGNNMSVTLYKRPAGKTIRDYIEEDVIREESAIARDLAAIDS